MTGQPGQAVIVGAGPAGMALAYLLLWLQRKERRLMMDGVVPVRLVV